MDDNTAKERRAFFSPPCHLPASCLRAMPSSSPEPQESAPAPAATSTRRLLSLDALRGFDMAFIVGFGTLLHAIAMAFIPAAPEKGHAPVPPPAEVTFFNDPARAIAEQFEHVDWEGFHLEDLIFPLFVFISGVSLTFSLPKSIERHGRGGAALRLLRRCALLFFLGVIYSGGFTKGFTEGWATGQEKVRWLGVLQRIALANLGAGLLYLWLRPRGLIVATVALLGGYWALLTFTNGGTYAEGANIVNQFDKEWLRGRKYDKDHDPEGILSTFPAIASALLGVLAGLWVRGSASDRKKAGGLALAGVVMLALGWAWSWNMPVIKKLWTSSFVLVAGGWSALLFALFYWLVEVCGFRAWTTPWVWIGANPITIYLAANFVPVSNIARRFTGPESQMADWLTWLVPAVSFGLVLLFARFLYKRGIFLRV
jgi:predicted acyltransferase